MEQFKTGMKMFQYIMRRGLKDNLLLMITK